MNYTYQILTNPGTIKPFLLVQEVDSKGFQWDWAIEALRNTDYGNGDIIYGLGFNSYQRTKKWLLNNYPELLL